MKTRTLIIIFLTVSIMIPVTSFAEPTIKTTENFQTGIVQWSSRCYSPSETAQITVIDRDMNVDPNLPDKFEIYVWSDWNIQENIPEKILSYTVTETGNSTGIFEGTIFLGSAGDEGIGHRVPVGNDNVIFVKYVDYTVSGSDKIEIIETATGKNLPFGGTWDKWEHNSLLLGIPLVYDPCMKKQIDIVGINDNFKKMDIIYPAPLKQIESGLYIDEIICKEDLVLIEKNNGFRYCVKHDTAPILFERGWATNANMAGESSRMCYSDPDPGFCEAAIEKYYFDWETGSCKSFTWGGCGGTVPFDTMGLCRGLCN